MKISGKLKLFILLFLLSFPALQLKAQEHTTAQKAQQFDPARPWVYWYWMDAAVSRVGIRKDLAAMKEAGIAGAYLMPVFGKGTPPAIDPPVVQLTPLWWKMMDYAMQEADSLGVKLAIDVNDGWATAGGPWITPALSMQKVVWSEVQVKGGRRFDDTLPQPETNAGYYRDIAVYAFPSLKGTGNSTYTAPPSVTSSDGAEAAFLAEKDNSRNFVSHKPCWIQYAFKKPFTCRSVKIRVRGIAFQAYRLLIEVSDDGMNFRSIGRLKPARSGWEDYVVPEATYAIPEVTAKYFRFVFNPAGTEPGSEDLDAAKWKPTFKLTGIALYSKPQINQFEGKDGEVWRIADRTTSKEIPDSDCVPKGSIINITRYMDASGTLHWDVPQGDWTILRMGHTSTGQENATGGGAKGLECDKFNPAAVKLQFNKWFGRIDHHADSIAPDLVKIFHVDSWECGSQNWSPVFRAAFKKYCGYDPLPFLPAMAGIPVQSARVSEGFLYDVRYTISRLIQENFFGTLEQLAHEKHCLFSAESVAPTMVSDGMLQDSKVDIPMGEFWLRSPTHDKPNDILDAVSGGHVYGKKIIQAESFTELREAWDEYPGMMKTLLDRNYAWGINRAVFHVFVENPWTDRKPGMTLNGVGTYFQRDQTWWKDCKAWTDYAARCERLLQTGKPVTDIAVYTGWEIPRRAVLPDRLVPVLPGIFGPERGASEKRRLANKGEPLQEKPQGVTSSANIFDPAKWIDPLHGYKYDSFNEDVLLNDASVKDGKVVFPGGASYSLLVVPGKRRMEPEGNIMKASAGKRLLQLVKDGATILVMDRPEIVPGYDEKGEGDTEISRIGHELFDGKFEEVHADSGVFYMKKMGKGRIIKGPFTASSFAGIGLQKDCSVTDLQGAYAKDIAWTHRRSKDSDIYFISNQLDSARTIRLSLKVSGKVPWLYDPVTGRKWQAEEWKLSKDRTSVTVKLPRNGSLFVILTGHANNQTGEKTRRSNGNQVTALTGAWKVRFDTAYGGPEGQVIFNQRQDWSTSVNDSIRHYSGTAVYEKAFNWKQRANSNSAVWLNLGKVKDIADVRVNGVDCGIAWTYPYKVDISKALRAGENRLNIRITNTWRNRLIGDHSLPPNKRVTWTNAPFHSKVMKLLPAGLLGPVRIIVK